MKWCTCWLYHIAKMCMYSRICCNNLFHLRHSVAISMKPCVVSPQTSYGTWYQITLMFVVVNRIKTNTFNTFNFKSRQHISNNSSLETSEIKERNKRRKQIFLVHSFYGFNYFEPSKNIYVRITKLVINDTSNRHLKRESHPW